MSPEKVFLWQHNLQLVELDQLVPVFLALKYFVTLQLESPFFEITRNYIVNVTFLKYFTPQRAIVILVVQ